MAKHLFFASQTNLHKMKERRKATRFDKAFEVYELLHSEPEQITNSDYEMESYEIVIKILKWKIQDEQEEENKEKLKAKLRAYIGWAARLCYPCLEMCEQMARDIADGKAKKLKFDSVRDVLRYYREITINNMPDLWRKNCRRIYRGSDHSYSQM